LAFYTLFTFDHVRDVDFQNSLSLNFAFWSEFPYCEATNNNQYGSPEIRCVLTNEIYANFFYNILRYSANQDKYYKKYFFIFETVYL